MADPNPSPRLVAQVAELSAVPAPAARAVLVEFLKLVQSQDRTMIREFGTFYQKEIRAHKVSTPMTGNQPVEVPTTRRLSLRSKAV